MVFGPELVLLLLALRTGEELDDTELARRIRKGDHEAFRAFFDRHHGPLLGTLRRRVRNDVAEDLVQHAFVYLWERRREIDPQRSLRAYLFRIGLTRAQNHARDTARFAGEDPAAYGLATADGEAPDARARHGELVARFDEAVGALPERRRAVFELCFVHDFTYREAAQALGVSVKTVENQMTAAFKTLRERLAAFR